MTNSIEDLKNVLKTNVVVTFVLFLKLVFVFLGVGGKKMEAGRRAPEDTYQKKPSSAEDQQAADENLDRWQRMTNNDFENVYPGLIIIWASGQVLPFGGSTDAHIAFATIFAAARVLHTITYLFKLSYPRSLAYFAGVLCMIGMLCNYCYAIFN